jgi:hypothetical protein
MAIVIAQEDKAELKKWGLGLERYLEKCHFCANPTDTWHMDSNTPVCSKCASTHDRSDISRKDITAKEILSVCS